MLPIIENNPFRVLGVFSNASKKDIVATQGKMTAYLKVGKPIETRMDLPGILPAIKRTEASINKADAQLTLPTEKLKYAQFWFVEETLTDEIAFNNLVESGLERAVHIWGTRTGVTSLQNRFVCALISSDWPEAVRLAETIYGDEQTTNKLTQLLLGEDIAFSQNDILHTFLDSLSEEVGIDVILTHITINEWKSYLSEKSTKPIVDAILSAIRDADASKKKGASARFSAGEKLLATGKPLIEQLKRLLTNTDIQYQVAADKLGLAVLQCAIDYYNDSDDGDAAYKVMPLQTFAKNTVVGNLAKERCKKSEEALQKIIRDLPPREILADVSVVNAELKKYCETPDEIKYAVQLLETCKPYLIKIRNKVGKDNAGYLKLSTRVVDNALHNVIEEVNAAQKRSNGFMLSNTKYLTKSEYYEHVLTEAWKITLMMDSFDMSSDFAQNRYARNRRILKELCDENLGRRTVLRLTRDAAGTETKQSPIKAKKEKKDVDNGVAIAVLVISLFLFAITTLFYFID